MKRDLVGYALLAPFLVLFIVFTVLPVLSSFALSLTDYNILQSPEFIGLNNFRLLFIEDDIFLIALENTLLFAVIAGPIGLMASFVFAWIINDLKFKHAFALAFYAPSLTSAIAMSSIWLYFFSNDRYGLINDLLIKFGLAQKPVLWTTSPKTILAVVIAISIWMSMGTGFLVFLAGFQNLSQEIYEAAAIDGVPNKIYELIYITIPMMKQQLLFGSVTAIVSAFAVFDIAVQVAGLPSPDYAGHTIVAHMYDYAFNRLQLGYASGVACVLFVLTFTLGRACMRIFRSDD